jgi:predicted nucleic acid-binding protein
VILVDTSVWIDFFRMSDKTLVDLMNGYLEDGEVVGVSAVFGELLQGAKNENEEKIILEIWNSLPKVNEADLFIEAGKISYKNRLTSNGIGLIDSYLLAAVKANKFSLWTLDKKLLAAYQKL